MALRDYIASILRAHDNPGVPPPRWKADAVMALALWIGRDVMKRLKDK